MLFGIPIVELFFSFLFLIPGFLTYKIGRHYGKITVPTDRFNKTVYSLIASGSSIAIVVILFVLLSGTRFGDLPMSDLSLFQLSLGYLCVLGVASIQGLGIGLIFDGYLRSDFEDRRERVWKLTFDGAEQPIEAHVFTQNGIEIHGYVKIYDSVGHGKDILIEYPVKILRHDDRVVNKTNLGNYAFVSEQEISHIHFEGELNVN